MSPRRLRRIEWPGPAGRLEGLLQGPEEDHVALAVVSHPHPLHGGTLHEKVTHRVARALEDSGFLVLRFNFRGVGRSEGVHDGGAGERLDLESALGVLRDRGLPEAPLVLAGFSFGSVVTAGVVAGGVRPAGLLLVGVPVGIDALPPLDAFPGPVAFVHGTADEHGPVERLRDTWPLLREPKQLREIEGADHFFTGRAAELHAAVRELADPGWLLGHPRA